jgi:outer membrane protein OmpA-like peptidoglycan-associated protein
VKLILHQIPHKMKTLTLAFVICAVSWVQLQAQVDGAEPDNYVVVIGAFSSEENASRFATQAKKYNIKPSSELNKIRGLYYVYIMQTPDKTSAVSEVMRVRGATPFADAWVYNGAMGDVVLKKPEPVAVVEQPVEAKIVPVETPAPAPVVPEKTQEEKIKEAVESKTMTLKKGETETLDYIFFYRDAAVLRPESKYEVDRLVQIMKSHPTEKICIHGHTNGNDKGKIIKMKPKSADFFSLENTVEDYGSAEELSEMRATVIRDYLITNGIGSKRMTIKAWGGKKPLFPVDDAKAEANVRVEIEVLNN